MFGNTEVIKSKPIRLIYLGEKFSVKSKTFLNLTYDQTGLRTRIHYLFKIIVSRALQITM